MYFNRPRIRARSTGALVFLLSICVAACGSKPCEPGGPTCKKPRCEGAFKTAYKPAGPIHAMSCASARGANAILRYECEVRHAQPGRICNGDETVKMVIRYGNTSTSFLDRNFKADGEWSTFPVSGEVPLNGADRVELELEFSSRSGCQPSVPSDNAQVMVDCSTFNIVPIGA